MLDSIRFVFLTFGTIQMIKDEFSGYVLSYATVVVLLYGLVHYWFVLELQKIADRTV